MDPSNAGSVFPGGSPNNIMARSPEADFDGKNRSLPHPKGGPYQCPRCEDFFGTSTVFASHMRSHYKSEREDRNRRRLETRRRRHHAKHCLAGSGLDCHDSSNHESKDAEVETLAGKAHTVVTTKDVEVQEEEVENGQGTGSTQENLETKDKPVI